MTGRAELFLGVIAFSTLALAVIQIALIVVVIALVMRVKRLADSIEQEIKPLFVQLNAIAGQTSRAASLAAAQVERVDELLADICTRVEQTLNVVQATVETPMREGRALLNAFRAGLDILREFRPGRPRSRQGRGDDDENLFV